MNVRRVISFPHMGDYSVPVRLLLRDIFPGCSVATAPPITRRTLETGSRHSPDMICAPFKYNIGNFIEALDAGANVLIQTGLGCRFGYYGKLQERILRELGYKFNFLCFSRDSARPANIYRICKQMGSPLGPLAFMHAALRALVCVGVMDGFANRMRKMACLENKQGAHEEMYARLLGELGECKTATQALLVGGRYRAARRKIALSGTRRPLRIGIVGELYTLMEPFSNFHVERELAGRGVSVSRKMSVTFLLLKRDWIVLRRAGKYLKYTIGANGADSVEQSLRYAKQGYDGIIHMSSFGCAPEVNATPVLQRISHDFHIPVLNLSFDAHTSEIGVQTRLEAFIDMLEMRRKINGANGKPGRGRRLNLDQGSHTR